MNKAFFIFLYFTFIFASLTYGQSHKGISFQGVIKLPDQTYPSVPGVTVSGLILSPNNCILREEEFSSVNIVRGYINLAIGTGAVIGDDPGLSMSQVMDNSKLISNLVCIKSGGLREVGDYNPASGNGSRKFRIILTVGSFPIEADFNMRSMAFAVNSETLNGKRDSDFLAVDAANQVTQTNLQKVLSQTTKIENLLSQTSSDGLSLNIVADRAITAVTAEGLASSYLTPLSQGGTGIAASSLGSLLNALLPAQASSAGYYLKTDGTAVSWSPVSTNTGTITEVVAGMGLSGGASTGVATLSLASVGVAGTYSKVTTDSYGRVTGGHTLNASDVAGLGTAATLNVGTTADSVAAGNDSRFTNSRSPSGSASGDLSGSYPGPNVARIRGHTVATTTITAAAGQAGKVYRWSGASGTFEPAWLTMSDIRTAAGTSQLPATSCTAGQTLTWSSLTDQLVCANITNLNASVITAGEIDEARIPASAKSQWTKTGSHISYSSGNVGVGVVTPASKLQIQGAITNEIVNMTGAFSCGFTNVNFASGNFIRLSPSNTISAGSCVVLLSNLVAGGSYTLVVTGLAASNAVTYSFSGYSFKYLPGNAATQAGKDTVYTFLYDGVTVYVTWASGY